MSEFNIAYAIRLIPTPPPTTACTFTFSWCGDSLLFFTIKNHFKNVLCPFPRSATFLHYDDDDENTHYYFVTVAPAAQANKRFAAYVRVAFCDGTRLCICVRNKNLLIYYWHTLVERVKGGGDGKMAVLFEMNYTDEYRPTRV